MELPAQFTRRGGRTLSACRLRTRQYNQPRSKPWSHSWKMFAVWPACNGADGINDIEHVAIGNRAGRLQRS
jgi:hypothetical protein